MNVLLELLKNVKNNLFLKRQTDAVIFSQTSFTALRYKKD